MSEAGESISKSSARRTFLRDGPGGGLLRVDRVSLSLAEEITTSILGGPRWRPGFCES